MHPPLTIIARPTSSAAYNDANYFTFTLPRSDLLEEPFWLQLKQVSIDGATDVPATFWCDLGIQSSHDTSTYGPGQVIGAVTSLLNADKTTYPAIYCHRRTANDACVFKILDADGTTDTITPTGIVVVIQITPV